MEKHLTILVPCHQKSFDKALQPHSEQFNSQRIKSEIETAKVST